MKEKRRWLMSIVALVGMCVAGLYAFGGPVNESRYWDRQTSVLVPEYVEGLTWATAPSEVVSAGSVVAVESPVRLSIAGDVLANLLSDPSFRDQIQVWFEHYVSINHPRDEASAMAKGHAAAIALAFTDALILAVEGG